MLLTKRRPAGKAGESDHGLFFARNGENGARAEASASSAPAWQAARWRLDLTKMSRAGDHLRREKAGAAGGRAGRLYHACREVEFFKRTEGVYSQRF